MEWPKAPYSGEGISQHFPMNVNLADFFALAVDATAKFAHSLDGAISPCDLSSVKVNDRHPVILLYLSDMGKVEQINTTLRSENMKANQFLNTRGGFDSRDCGRRLYDANLDAIKGRTTITKKYLSCTAWSKNLPVLWAISARSVFRAHEGLDSAEYVLLNIGDLYYLPPEARAYLSRNVHVEQKRIDGGGSGATDDDGVEDCPAEVESEIDEDDKPLFRLFETEAFVCEVHMLFERSESIVECQLLETRPRYPVHNPNGLCSRMQLKTQGTIALRSSDKFNDRILDLFMREGSGTQELSKMFQLEYLMRLDEEQLVTLLRRVQWNGAAAYVLKTLLRAPWIVTKNLYCAREGSCVPLGAEAVNPALADHIPTSLHEHLGRRAFTKIGSETSEVKAADMCGHSSNNQQPLRGESLVRMQQMRICETFDEFTLARKQHFDVCPPTLNVTMMICSFSYARVELHRTTATYKQYRNVKFDEENMAKIQTAIPLLISMTQS